MSYVDLIIKYLSGDLSQEEATSFEKEMESNGELKREFEQKSAAFELIRDELQKRDAEEFRTKLREAMNPASPLSESRKRLPWSRWSIPLAAAFLLAIIIISTQLTQHGNQKLFSSYYEPATDPVVLAFNQETRGEPEPGIVFYGCGEYQKSMEILSIRIAEERENKQLLLFYLLSAIELDRQDEVLELVHVENPDSMGLPDQSITWYATLALLKSERREAARERIRPLTEQQGPYHSDAIKLEKVLLK